MASQGSSKRLDLQKDLIDFVKAEQILNLN